MTLEELQLRVEAAFPGCKFTPDVPDEDHEEDYQSADVCFAAPEEILGVIVWGFVAIVSDDPLEIEDVDGDFGCRSSSDSVSEIERRILNLTGHQEMAIRRRFAGGVS